MGDNKFGTAFGTGRSSKAGYGISLGAAAGRTPERQQAIDARKSGIEAERAAKKLETEVDTGPTNAEEREQRNTEKAIEARIKAEEEKRFKAAREAQEGVERARAEAARAAAAVAKGEQQMGVTKPTSPSPAPEAPPSPSPPPAAPAPAAPTPEQIKARQEAAEQIKAGLRGGSDEALKAAREAALAAGVPQAGVDAFEKMQKQQNLRDRQEAARGLEKGIQSGDYQTIADARQKASDAGVASDRLESFEQKQKQKLDTVPLGFTSGRSKPIAPNWRIHTRLSRQLTARSQATGRDRSISPEAATMKYNEALMRKAAREDPYEYIKLRRANQQPPEPEDYGFRG